MTPLLTELPTEILDLVVHHAYIDGCRLVRAIIPLSLTCKALRSVAKPILFATLTIETNTYYLNTERVPPWQNDDKPISLVRIMPHIADYITTLKFVSWRRRTQASYSSSTWKFPEDLNMDSIMPRLKTIIFDPPHTCTRSILRTLARANAHIIFEYRNHDSPSSVTICEPAEHPNSTWSISCGAGHEGATSMTRNVCKRLKALQWTYPTNRLARDSHIKLLEYVQSSPFVEELHVSERIRDLDETFSQNGSCATQICALISSLPLLQRLRVEGNSLTKEFLVILPQMVTLEDLSIYSVYRRVFHETCDTEESTITTPGPTADTPWLTLPRLRKLDLRFICKHFAMHQLIPKGLIALRLEFWDVERRLTPEDLDWLVRYCPNLERLELDMGPTEGSIFQADNHGDSISTFSQFLNIAKRLQGLRHLNTLRLFPSYWGNGKLFSHPFDGTDSVASAVRIFRSLRSVCVNLRLLIISISFGEYPFDAVPRMSMITRPTKFVLRDIGIEDDTLVQWSYGGNDEMEEVVYRGGKPLPGTKIIPVSPKSFFDDLNEDWILPHYELDK